MDVSIIYVNYRTSRLVIDSINSVKEKTQGILYEIIIVDNNSGDGSLAKIQEIHPDVITIQSEKNVGFGQANNLGLKKADGKYIFFLNPDTLLRNNAIGELFRFLELNMNVGACGGNLYDEEGNATTSFSRKYPSFLWELLGILYIPSLCFSSRRSLFFNHEGKPIKVASVTGADLMVRRSVLSSIGRFDADFFMNYEETELCLRIHRSGWDIYSVPSAQITHLEGRASYITKVSHPLKHQLFSFSFVCLPPYPLTVNTCLTEVMQTIHILRPIFPTLQPLQGFCSSLCRFR